MSLLQSSPSRPTHSHALVLRVVVSEGYIEGISRYIEGISRYIEGNSRYIEGISRYIERIKKVSVGI